MYKEIFHASSWKISKKRGGHKGLERTNIRRSIRSLVTNYSNVETRTNYGGETMRLKNNRPNAN